MAGIYAADIYCNDCVEKIKVDTYYCRFDNESGFSRDEWEVAHGFDDEHSYDSDEYPKYCDDSGESDSPQHCAKCHVFLENDLTADGYDYVENAIQDDLDADNFDSVAITVWADFYGLGVVAEIDIRADECSKMLETFSENSIEFKVCRA